MPRTPNRPKRRRRHEIDLQVVEDIQTSNIHTGHADENSNETEQDNEAMSLRASDSDASAAEQHSTCTLQCWKASTSEYETTCELFSTDDTVFTCPIMHKSTCSAIVEDLPATWPLPGNACANTVRLPCLHTFLAPALALHVLATDMPKYHEINVSMTNISTIIIRSTYINRHDTQTARQTLYYFSY